MSVRARRLPPALKQAIWRVAAVVDAPMRLLYRMLAADRRAVPPVSVRRVAGSLSPRAFFDGGRAVLDDLDRILADAGHPLSRADDVLDLACGPGRVSLHLVERYPNVRLTGCDVDARAVRWAARHLEGRFLTTSPRPPLPFDEGSFDVVFSYSLWTHLSEPDQLAWLTEVRRLLRPGGAAVVTTHGVGMHSWLTRSPEAFVQSLSFMERLRRAGDPRSEDFIFVPYESSAVSGLERRGIEGAYGMSFQTPAYTRTRWSDHMEVLDVVPDGIVHQDAVLLARRPQSSR